MLYFEVKKIFETCIKKLYSSSDLNFSLLNAVVTLLLQITSKFKEISSHCDHEKNVWMSERLEKLWPEVTNLLLDEWVTKYYTSVFGGVKLHDSGKDITVYII